MSNFSNFSNQPYRYILEKGSRKYYCPNCKKRTFVRYVDTKTGDHLPEQYGRCDRESKCSYHLNPYLDGYAKVIWEREQKVTGVTKVTVPKQKNFRTQPKTQPTHEPVFFDLETFKQTLQPERYEKNTFIQNLFYRVQFPFEVDEVTKVVQLYRLGTVANGYRAGAITFPFIDKKGNVRAVQVKQFDEQNHTTGTDFLHSIIEKHHTRNNKPLPEWLEAYTKQDKRVTCLFGEHLLSKYPNNPVALVEAPKTAVYGTLYFGLPETPESLIWLAIYNKSSFSFDKLKALQGRFVYVFPDLSKDGSTFKEWETKAKEYEDRLPGTRFIFSDLLERLAPEPDRIKGYDLADYLIKLDWRAFREQNAQEQPPLSKTKKVTKVTNVTPQTNNYFFQPDPLPVEETLTRNAKEGKDYWTVSEFSEAIKEAKNEKTEFSEAIKEARASHPEFSEVIKREQCRNGWSGEIEELEAFFLSVELPTAPIKLNSYSTIVDCSLFVKTSLSTLKAKNGNKYYLPFLTDLKELKMVLTEGCNC